MHEESLIRRVKKLAEEYAFVQPFANYLKKYFQNHPEMGARDRRETRDWSIHLLRIGKNLSELSFEKRLGAACFLCSNNLTPSLSYLIKTYTDFSESDIEKPVEEKAEMISKKYSAFSLEKIFPMHHLLSPQIKRKEWFISFLNKPKVWIRIRKIYREAVIKELNEKQILFIQDEDPLILSFPKVTALDNTNAYQNGYFEIQDKYSQLTRDFFYPGLNEYWWDACAGAGGKSLLLKEVEPTIKIFATDIRENILRNYMERMKKSVYKFTETKVADLMHPIPGLHNEIFDGIIADVPCSGSGTWSRSPEWLQKNIEQRLFDHYIPLQRNIISSVLSSLKIGFPLIYITCSVFKKENEEVIDFARQKFHLQVQKMEVLKGYDQKADTMFAASLVHG